MVAITIIRYYIELIESTNRVNNMDGNLAALNEHLARQEDIDYESTWKENYIEECVDAAMYGLELEKEFKNSKGISRDMIDAICEIEGDAKKVFNAILFQAVFGKYESKALKAYLQEKVREELATWVNAKKAFEQHVKDNEPQEP